MSTELKKLQGTWNISALEVDGRPMAAGGSQIRVEGDRFTSLGMGVTYEGKLVLDSSQSPWAIDMEFTAGPEKGNVNRGIFEFQGERWRLCLQMTGKSRPKEFATRPGAGLALETLERAKPGAKRKVAPPAAVPADFPTDPVPELEGEWGMTACSHNGQPLEAAILKMGRRVAQGNETTVFMGKQVMLQARYAVDRSRQPHEIDYLLTHGPAAGQKQMGIFELQGVSLKVSFAAPGQARPTDFSSAPGDGRTVTGWMLVKR